MGEIVSGDRRISTAELGLRAAKAATALDSVGVKPGNIIALFLRNDVPFFEASMAAGILGVYPTPANWHAT
ncbi:MAG: long-chain fatty acid--CoA ligase, partial [Burkholderiales bacterium]